MLITLNLLAGEQKQRLKSRKLTLLTAKTASIALTATVILTILAGGAEFMMKKTLEKIQATAYAGSAEFNTAIKKINLLSALHHEAGAGYYRWSEALATLAAATPPGVTLSAARIDSAAGSLLLQGLARERADLLQLQENLQQSPLFSAVSVPLQDLSEKTNGSFNITLTINTEML